MSTKSNEILNAVAVSEAAPTRFTIALTPLERPFAAAFVRIATFLTAEEGTRAAIRVFNVPHDIAKGVVVYLNECLLEHKNGWQNDEAAAIAVLSNAFSAAFWTAGLRGNVKVV